MEKVKLNLHDPKLLSLHPAHPLERAILDLQMTRKDLEQLIELHNLGLGPDAQGGIIQLHYEQVFHGKHTIFNSLMPMPVQGSVEASCFVSFSDTGYLRFDGRCPHGQYRVDIRKCDFRNHIELTQSAINSLFLK